jgi:uncharacterized RDD family membrane protein YckC
MEMVLDQVCASCGNQSRPYGRFCLFCGDILSESGSKISIAHDNRKRTVPVASELNPVNYAGFWIRACAGTIDVVLEAAGALVLTFAIDFLLGRFGSQLGLSPFVSKVATGMAFILILSVGSWLYCAFAESSCWRATVGKRLLGLQVVNAEGGRISFGQATVRHLMKFLSLFILTIGFMMAGWTKRRQALHDMPSDCFVIRVPAA